MTTAQQAVDGNPGAITVAAREDNPTSIADEIAALVLDAQGASGRAARQAVEIMKTERDEAVRLAGVAELAAKLNGETITELLAVIRQHEATIGAIPNRLHKMLRNASKVTIRVERKYLVCPDATCAHAVPFAAYRAFKDPTRFATVICQKCRASYPLLGNTRMFPQRESIADILFDEADMPLDQQAQLLADYALGKLTVDESEEEVVVNNDPPDIEQLGEDR